MVLSPRARKATNCHSASWCTQRNEILLGGAIDHFTLRAQHDNAGLTPFVYANADARTTLWVKKSPVRLSGSHRRAQCVALPDCSRQHPCTVGDRRYRKTRASLRRRRSLVSRSGCRLSVDKCSQMLRSPRCCRAVSIMRGRPSPRHWYPGITRSSIGVRDVDAPYRNGIEGCGRGCGGRLGCGRRGRQLWSQ